MYKIFKLNSVTIKNKPRSNKELYDPGFVKDLFDKMSSTYSVMNYISSFGFSERWRKQFIKEQYLNDANVVVDLMTGMGECWKYIIKKTPVNCQLIALDFSSEMVKQARKLKTANAHRNISVLEENVFENSIDDNVADCVFSAFGLKTFNESQLEGLAKEIHRILKQDGTFTLIDISVPKGIILRKMYMFYLKFVIPILGKIFLGDPDNYRMLGIYTENFENARKATNIFKAQNFDVEYNQYFFGCASGIKGKKNDK